MVPVIQILLALGSVSQVIAVASPDAIAKAFPMAGAIPQAAAAAEAYANAYALAEAAGNPDPHAFAMAEDEETPVCGTEGEFSCHAACGGMARNARTCSDNGRYSGPFDHECLCGDDAEFMNLSARCLECGWSLWDSYGSFLSNALLECDLPSEPTGAQCGEVAEASATGSSNSSTVQSGSASGSTSGSASGSSSGSSSTTLTTSNNSSSAEDSTGSSTGSNSSSLASNNAAVKATVSAGLIGVIAALLI
jgi:hypothetical protein